MGYGVGVDPLPASVALTELRPHATVMGNTSDARGRGRGDALSQSATVSARGRPSVSGTTRANATAARSEIAPNSASGSQEAAATKLTMRGASAPPTLAAAEHTPKAEVRRTVGKTCGEQGSVRKSAVVRCA
jgi:hypothetical protein